MRKSPLIMLIFLPLAAAGGITPSEVGDSPLWWTLTEEISPAELRAVHEDLELHRARYAEAAAAGYRHMLAEPSSAAQVKVFYDGSLHPVLVPMWQAFNAFAYRFHEEAPGSYLEEAPAALAGYGIEKETGEKVLGHALRFLAESQELVSQLKDEQLAFVEILREAGARLDRETYREAVEGRDAALLARTVGRDPVLVERLMRVWHRDPITERAVVSLGLLKTELSPADWDRLRRFLFREVAPGISVLDFDDDKNNQRERRTAR